MFNKSISISVSNEESYELAGKIRVRRKCKKSVFRGKNELAQRLLMKLLRWWPTLLFLLPAGLLILEASRIGRKPMLDSGLASQKEPKPVVEKKSEANLNRLNQTTRVIGGIRQLDWHEGEEGFFLYYRYKKETRESLYEDEEFDQRQLAALLVSKVFYYLGELNDSLSYALGAGPMFDVSEDSDYVHTLLAKAIDEYVSLKLKAAESNDEAAKMDPRLEAIVERMLDKCILDGKYQQAIGIAIECRRLDKLEEAIMRSDNIHATLLYCINISHSFVNLREYRHELHMHVHDFLAYYVSIC
ncbi:hypothetical protein LOK49_LG13G01921 [Camellia lanceoleosa]|uniref:Uncharacterized protein n=1 Tax=Camellia lanceoleosa TaxID=1840588 RepID=A0ACC0FID1_9ERIC|nr:hypothetical protein LOK49_LG13G01921 [Camellia lanceoleosa]